jgi:hypothetical protein
MQDTPALTLVLVAYNMARELPRTLRSLSVSMQRGLAASDYEVIVLDNGSTQPFDEDACKVWAPDARFIYLTEASPSPVEAINIGLAEARGGLIGVWIDGARLASPGLLGAALEAARLHPRPVIGTVGLHLGPDIQARSIQQGYSQSEEDRLLASIDWTSDGYRLFEISSFAGSSGGGWFGPIAESNALFLTREHWRALGGYEARFQMPGGGLANHDVWRRACLDPDAQTMILLGEGTFHQLHGGVATNSERPMYPVFDEEYRRIRGEHYALPAVAPLYVGRVAPAVMGKLAESASGAVEK